jgi:hypothetical protein
VRRSGSSRKPLLVLASGLALLVLLAVALSVHHYRQPVAAPPEALAHIAQKNRDAAIAAAAQQRVEAAARSNAAEGVAEAERRGEPANVAIRELGNGSGEPARHD